MSFEFIPVADDWKHPGYLTIITPSEFHGRWKQNTSQFSQLLFKFPVYSIWGPQVQQIQTPAPTVLLSASVLTEGRRQRLKQNCRPEDILDTNRVFTVRTWKKWRKKINFSPLVPLLSVPQLLTLQTVRLTESICRTCFLSSQGSKSVCFDFQEQGCCQTQIKPHKNTRHSIEENSLNSSYSDLLQKGLLAPWWWWSWTHHLRLRSYITSHHTWLIQKNYSMMYWSVFIVFKSFPFSSLTFNNCPGPLAWFHWLCNEQTLIMGCLQLIFFLPAAELSDGFTPRSFTQACHFVLRCFCHCDDYKIIKSLFRLILLYLWI